MKNILIAKANVDRLLGENISEKEKEKHKKQKVVSFMIFSSQGGA
jgi:hypothetical protein